jgi:hypothetical protein
MHMNSTISKFCQLQLTHLVLESGFCFFFLFSLISTDALEGHYLKIITYYLLFITYYYLFTDYYLYLVLKRGIFWQEKLCLHQDS